MVFRYWKKDGHTTVLKDVDRIVFDSLVKLNIRSLKSGHYGWVSFAFGDDYSQFTLSEE